MPLVNLHFKDQCWRLLPFQNKNFFSYIYSALRRDINHNGCSFFFQVFWQRLPNRWYLVYSDVARVISNVLFPYRVPFFLSVRRRIFVFLWSSFYCFILISLNVIINASSFHLVYLQYVHCYTYFSFFFPATCFFLVYFTYFLRNRI